MMLEQDALDRIRAATAKTARTMNIAGPCIVVLGLFMIALHALELDSEAADMSTAALIALYGFALVFVATGLLMLYIGLFKFAAMGRAVIGALIGDPSVLEKVEYTVIQAANAPGRLGRVHQLRFDLRGRRKATTLTVREEDVEPILALVREKAPHALSGG
ncbi:MAG: hypothetical protein KUG77_23220 [Nannocystaceae bacterium]|nr:hypothetical protein [Nannocystaceae bacterium]